MRYRSSARGLLREEHAYECLEIAHTLLRICGEQTRRDAEGLRSDHRHRVLTPELRKGADEMQTAKAVIAVVPDVVEGTSPYDQE